MNDRFVSVQRHIFAAMTLFGLMIFTAPTAKAQTVAWTDATASTAWYTATNWTPNTASTAWLTTNIAQFNNTGTANTAGINMGTSALSIGAIEVSSLRTRGLTIGNSSATVGSLTLNGTTVNSVANVVLRNASGSLLTLQDNETGTGKTMNVVLANTTNNVILLEGAGGITISSIISGTGRNLTLQGGGTGVLTLSGANTFSGTTRVSTAGNVLAIGNNLALQNSTIDTSGAGTFTMTGFTTPTIGGLIGSTDLATVFTAGYSSVTTLTLNPGAGINNTYSGAIANGAMILTKTGAGIQALSGTNSYTGGTNVNVGTLTYLNTNAQSATGTTTVAALATLGLGVATSGSFYTSSDVDSLFAGTLTNVTNSATSNVGIDTTAGDFTYSSNVAAMTRGLAKLGANTLTLSGSNAFTGGVTINAGTLLLGNAGALNSTVGSQNAVTFGAGSTGTLALAGNSVIIANLSTDATTPGTTFVQNANGSSVANATLTVGNSLNLSGTYAGTLQNGTGGGTLGLTKEGTGTLTISGTNTYTGTTTINAGTLQIGGAGTLNSGTYAVAIALGSGSTLRYSSSADQTLSGPITGSGGVTKDTGGGSTLTLSGTNSYTGVTNISAGILRLANTVSLYNGTVASWTATNIRVASGGTLVLNVGGTGEFTTSNVTTLLTNLGGLGGAPGSGNGLQSGSNIGFATSNAVGGVFTIADNITNSTGTGGGAIGLSKFGSNTLVLTGTNTYTGGTTIGNATLSGGTLRVSNGAIGSGSIGLNNATLASSSSAAISIPGNVSNIFTGGTFTFGDSVGTGAITLAGGLSLSSGGTGRTVNTVVDVNVTGVLSGSNSASLTKSGTATLTLSNVAGTTNGVNNIIITAGTLAVTRLANSTVNSSIGRTNVATTVASITIDGGALNYITGGAAASSTDRLLQIGQTTAGAIGTIRNNASSATETVTFSNTNAILYGTTAQTRSLVLGGTNTGLNTLASAINNNGTGVVNVVKQESGTWVLTATNAYTGTTAVTGGTLVLNYGTNDTTKLSDTAALTLTGSTLNLTGGTHTEVVLSTTLTAATGSFVTRTSGTAVLQMGTITNNTATVNFSAASIATANNVNNATGILGTWATVGGDWATTAASGTNIAITAYTGYSDVTRLESGTKAIPNTTTANVRIIEGTGVSPANITLAAATTAINTLNQSISGGTSAATVALAGQTLRTNGILMGPTAGTLTIGAAGGSAAVSGTLTNQTGAGGSLIFTNNSVNDLVINSVLADNSTTNTYVKAGTGALVLAGDNTFNFAITIQDGIVKAGKNSTSNSVGPFGGANSSASIILANKATAGLDINGFNVFVKDLQGGGTLGGNVTLSSGNTLTIQNPASGSAIYNGIITGAGNLTLTGSSGQTFNTAHTYTGVTSWIGGVGLTVNSIANGGSPSGIGQSSSLASNLILGGGGNLAYNSSTVASTDRLFTLSGNFTLNVSGAGSLTFANTGAVVHSGVAAKTLTLGGTGAGSGTMALSISDSGTLTNITGIAKAGTNAWSLTSTSNTFTGTITLNSTTTSAGTLAYASAGGTNPITFNQTTSTATLVYTGSGQTMSGAIMAAGLTTGTITLGSSGTGAINYSNTASLGVTAAIGAKALVLTGTNTGNNTLAGLWANNTAGGAATLTKNGAGTWAISGANAYTGATQISAGTLLVNGIQTAAVGTVTVASTATLGGTGTVGGVTTVQSGGFLAPGASSSGTLTINANTTLASGSFYAFELSTAGAATTGLGTSSPSLPHTNHDVLSVTGTLTLTGSTVNITSLVGTGLDNATGYSWLIATASGGITGTPVLGSVSGTDFTAYATAGGIFALETAGNNLYLSATPVPEPATVGLIAAAGLGLGGYIRRRRVLTTNTVG